MSYLHNVNFRHTHLLCDRYTISISHQITLHPYKILQRSHGSRMNWHIPWYRYCNILAHATLIKAAVWISMAAMQRSCDFGHHSWTALSWSPTLVFFLFFSDTLLNAATCISMIWLQSQQYIVLTFFKKQSFTDSRRTPLFCIFWKVVVLWIYNHHTTDVQATYAKPAFNNRIHSYNNNNKVWRISTTSVRIYTTAL